MDRKVFEALSSANKLINHQLDCQKAAILDIKKAIEETSKAFNITYKQGRSEGFESETIEDTAGIYALLVGAKSEIECAVSKLEEAKNMMPNFDKGKNI
jgi:hypothetical protein